MRKKSAILMATYNGERYIRQQIDSIVRQTDVNWELFIRDDGSTDNTVKIITEYCKIDSRIHLLPNQSEYHGPFLNFHFLINELRKLPPFNYYYFCDQDDIWQPDKLELMNNHFNEKGIPELIYSDMTIIDGDNQVVLESNNKARGLTLPNSRQLYFSHAYIWGCAAAFNRELLELVPTIDIEAHLESVRILSHDNYFSKFALEHGKVTYFDKTLIRYRRHSNNVSEISKIKMGLYEMLKLLIIDYQKKIKLHARTYSQTLFMIDVARENNLQTDKLDEIEKAICQGGIQSVWYLKKHHIKKNQVSKTAFMYWIMLTGSYKKYLR